MSVQQTNTAGTAVVLPCSPEDFASFVESLLGKPQEISFGKAGAFCVKRQDLIDLFHIVDQRITQQNHGNRIAFTVRVVYEDGLSVVLNTLAELESYRETRDVTSTQAHLSWTYLIQFPMRASPEKQDIEVSFYATDAQIMPRRLGLALGSPFAIASTGHIEYRIKHTMRTWGADIEGHLTNYVSGKIERMSPLRKFVWKQSVPIAIFIALVFFVSSMFMADAIQNRYAADYWAALQPVLSASATVDEKLDTLLKVTAQGAWQKYESSASTFKGIVGLLAFVIFFLTEKYADHRKPSFVVLTDKAEKVFDKAIRKFERSYVKFWGSIVIAFVINVLSSHFYDQYAKEKIFTPLTKALDLKK